MTKDVYIIGGGTVSYVRPHLVLAAPAYGTVVDKIAGEVAGHSDFEGKINTYYTRMAGDKHESVQVSLTGGVTQLGTEFYGGTKSGYETNDDIVRWVNQITSDPAPKIVFFPVAICDWEAEQIDFEKSGDNPQSGFLEAGRQFNRLSTHSDMSLSLKLKPAAKIINLIRKDRKDIFLIGFKTTTGATPQSQFFEGLDLLKRTSCNLVLANDIRTLKNIIVTPEQAPYGPYSDRGEAIAVLVDMAISRSKGHFTRSRVVSKDYVQWNSPEIPDSLRKVVNHCISRGAYKTFQGKTVGHFAVRQKDGTFLTSMRGVDFNKLANHQSYNVGMVKVTPVDDIEVEVNGGKPSVGGQSQRIIFRDHPDVDCIVHFHCPLRKGFEGFPKRPQAPFECGSHECGQNTSDGLQVWVQKDDTKLKAVMLDKHGPNIVFHRNMNPDTVIAFIEKYWDLERSISDVIG